MSPANIFTLQLVLGYVAWLLCYRAYLWPRLKTMDPVDAHRAIATLHSFRFFGLVFVIPGVVGSHLPGSFAGLAAYADLATGVLAILALLAVRLRPLFWLFVVAFNVVGIADLLVDYYHAVHAHLPDVAGELGAAYVIPVIYVPLLMITHVAAFYLLARPPARQPAVQAARAAAA
ncbi:hypothetical protein [Frateuria sp. YIM B11624]|uniref:hypothetical protein n=1 Tax=Frateuria sp. YIM B11624 TaxID=3143185 RepID=UPI003C72F52D